MMNISLISKIALSTVAASIASMAIAPSALAYTFNLSGSFDDGGTLSGTFDFDETTDTYSNTDLITTGGSTLSGTTYTDDTLIFGNSSGFEFDDDSGDVLLTVDFVSNLSSTSGAIALDTNFTQEENFLIDTRMLSSGTVTPVTPVVVPFEPSSNLAIFVVLGLMGLNRYRKR